MMRSLLVRGMLAGLVAGVLTFVFAFFVGEPALDGGIAYEDAVSAATGHSHEGEPLVSRGAQSTIGLLVALLIYGVAIGGIFSLVYAGVYGRIVRLSPRATAALLAAVGYVVVILVPFLKYPSNPPASSLDETIGIRTGTYVILVALSVAAAVAAVALGQRLVARFGTWNGVLLAAAAYIVVMAVVGALMPVIAETPTDFPAVVLYDFRLATLGLQLVLWAAIGLVFGALVERRSQRPGHRSGSAIA